MWSTTTEDNYYINSQDSNIFFYWRKNSASIMVSAEKRNCCAMHIFCHVLPRSSQILGILQTIAYFFFFFPPGFSLVLQNNIVVAHIKLPDCSNVAIKKSVGPILPQSTAASVFTGRWRLKATDNRARSDEWRARGWDSKGHNHEKKAGWPGTYLIWEKYKKCRKNPNICMKM